METKDTEKELSALREKHAKAERDLLRENAIRAALPDSLNGMRVFVHLHGLYGTTASVKIEHDYFAYGQPERRQPTLDTVAELANAFPPLPVRKIKDGCLSFQLAGYVDALDEAKKERWQEEIAVSPFRVTVSAFQQRTMKVEWAAKIGDEVVDFDVVLPLANDLGTLDVRYQKYMGGQRVDRCSFTPNHNAIFTIFRNGEPVAELGPSPIKWGRGSDDVPNDFTLYWHDLREDVTATAADFTNTLKAATQAVSQ